MLSVRLALAVALAALALDARAQTDADPPLDYTHVMLTASADAPAPDAEVPDDALGADVPTVTGTMGETLVVTVVEEPAPIEDPVQLRMPRAPVRMELAQTRRRVVLLPGVSQLDLDQAYVPPAVTIGHVTYSRAIVVVSENGRREVQFMDGAAPDLDLGVATGCDGAALDVALRLRGLRATPLRLGMRGEAVEAAQHLLCAAGLDVEPNGVFNARMDDALRAFQRQYNAAGLGRALVVDGALGPKTRKALDVMIAARTQG